MPRDSLGELEHRVLLSVSRLGGDAYSVSVILDLEACTGKEYAAAAIHIAMRRLEEKGFVHSALRHAPSEEGGRERRYYEVTPAGWDRMVEERREFEALWSGVPAKGGS